MNTYLTENEFKIIAGTISDKTGITFKNSGDKLWKVDIRSKVISYPRKQWMNESDIGYLIHEAAHLRFGFMDDKFYDDLKKVLKATGKKYKQVYKLFEVIEDIRVDGLVKNIYQGASHFYEISDMEQFDLFIDSLESISKEELEEINEKAKTEQHAIYVLLYAGLGKYYGEYYAEYIGKNTLRVGNNTIKHIDEISEADTPDKVLEVLKKTLPLYLELCDDEDGKEEEKKEEDIKNILDKLLSIMAGAIKRAIEGKQENKENEKKGESISGIAQKGETTTAEDIKRGIDLDKQDFKNIFGYNSENHFTIEDLNYQVDKNLPKVRKAVSILKDMNTERYEGNYQSGKLENRKLFKLTVGKTNIFSRKIADMESDKDMAIGILVDESGSMDAKRYNENESEEDYEMTDSRCKNACIASTLLIKALELSHKPCLLAGFNENFNIRKPWNKKMSYVDMLEIVEEPLNGPGNGDTLLVMGLRKFEKLMSKRSERNKIIIILTDGQTHDSYFLPDQIKRTEKIAKIYVIGINTDYVKNYFKNWKVVNDVSELGDVVIDIFKKNAGKRIRK